MPAGPAAAASIARVVSAAAIRGTSAIIRPSAGSLTDEGATIVGGFPAAVQVGSSSAAGADRQDAWRFPEI
jgi:hypothetical protein